MAQQPSVLFILVDQHNAKVLGHQGHPDVKTPNLDRLASQGVRFQNAIAQSPICTPSRICYLSGQYCHNHGYFGLSGPNPGGLPTILGHFRGHGYTTGAIGKIHCPEYWVEDDCDVFHETTGLSVAGRSQDYANYLRDRGLTDLEDHESLAEFGPLGLQTCDGRPSRVSYRDGQEGWIVTQSIEFMSNAAKRKQPFFLHVSLPKPHECFTPAQEFWDLYDGNRLSLPPNADYDMSLKAPHLKRAAKRWLKGDWTLFEPRTFEAGRLRRMHGYLGCVSHVDHAVGELMDWVDQAGLTEEILMIYCSDHGDYACEHGNMEKAPGICGDAVNRVPFIWRWPGRFKEGHVSRELVETVDLATTVCAQAGLPSFETGDGQDLSHLLCGESGEVRKRAVTELAWSKSLQKGNFRLVYYPHAMFAKEYPEGFGELYDLESDPWEMRNLYFEPGFQGKVEELRADLLEWLITTKRPATVLPCPTPQSSQTRTRYQRTVNKDGKIRPEWIGRMKNIHYL